MQTVLPRPFIILISLVAVIWLLQWAWGVIAVLNDILLLFFLAWLLGFIMQPLIHRLQEGIRGRFGLPRVAAISIVYLAILALLIGSLLVLIPLAIRQTMQIARQAPGWVAQLPSRLAEVEDNLQRVGIEVDLDGSYRRVDLVATAQAWGAQATGEAVRMATGVATSVGKMLLVIVISFYMSLDLPRIQRRIQRIAPPQWSEELAFFNQSVYRTFGGFVRSQLVLSLLTAIGTLVIMEVARLPFALLISLVAGTITLLPYLGSTTAFFLPTLIAWQQSPLTGLGVGLAILTLHQTLSRLIMPRIISQQMGLPPVLVFAGMLIGVRLAGVWGALFGAPIVGILYTMFVYLYERFVLRPTTS